MAQPATTRSARPRLMQGWRARALVAHARQARRGRGRSRRRRSSVRRRPAPVVARQIQAHRRQRRHRAGGPQHLQAARPCPRGDRVAHLERRQQRGPPPRPSPGRRAAQRRARRGRSDRVTTPHGREVRSENPPACRVRRARGTSARCCRRRHRTPARGPPRRSAGACNRPSASRASSSLPMISRVIPVSSRTRSRNTSAVGGAPTGFRGDAARACHATAPHLGGAHPQRLERARDRGFAERPGIAHPARRGGRCARRRRRRGIPRRGGSGAGDQQAAVVGAEIQRREGMPIAGRGPASAAAGAPSPRGARPRPARSHLPAPRRGAARHAQRRHLSKLAAIVGQRRGGWPDGASGTDRRRDAVLTASQRWRMMRAPPRGVAGG